MHFLSIIWITFPWARGIVVVMDAPAREMDSPAVDSEIQRKMCEIVGISALKDYQVEALKAVCLNERDTLVCVPTGSRKSACFEVIRAVIDHVTGTERAT